MSSSFTILGSGTSTGVPAIGCSCKVCLSHDSRDKRTRSSIILHTNSGNILVDTSPDLRTQVLRENITSIKAAILTHEHADHLHGIDDLRPFSFYPPHEDIPIFTSKQCKQSVEKRFDYIFKWKDTPVVGGGIPKIELYEVALDRKQQILNEDFTFFLFPHGRVRTLGFIHNKLGYIIDCKKIPDQAVSKFREAQLDWLIIDCLKTDNHDTHLTYSETKSYIERIAPKKAGLIHMNHDHSHLEWQKFCQNDFPNIKVGPVFDGMKAHYG